MSATLENTSADSPGAAAGTTLDTSQARAAKVAQARRAVLSPVGLVGIAWCAFQIFTAQWPYLDELVKRAAHVSFALSLALLFTSEHFTRPFRLLNHLLALVVLTPPVILWFELPRINERIPGLDDVLMQDYFCAGVMLILLFEVSRRVLGFGMTILGIVFLAYQFLGTSLPGLLAHNSANFAEFVEIQVLTIEGVFGIPVSVSARLVFYFILFAAVYEVFGGGQMIINLSLALTGPLKGGPAKAAVLSSGLMGSVSGSAVANVMSTGVFTIPLMKRVKYRPLFAAGVEAVASTGGQIMPPVMGAAAFIMADYLQLPYGAVVIAATIPALLYFACVMLCINLEARYRDLPPIDRSELPGVGDTLKQFGHMLVPLAWLAYRIFAGHDVTSLLIEVIVLTIVIGSARRSTRVHAWRIVEGFTTAARRTVNVAMPCALAGLIVSVVAFTGLGTKFTAILLAVAGQDVTVILMVTMVATLVLGAGMPTASAYIMGAVLIVPALVEFGMDPLICHFFVFYFAIMSMLTPPVALSAYAAASIADTSPSRTGWQAVLLALPGFIIPFAFVVHPGLLLVGDFTDTLHGLLVTAVSLTCVGAAVIGWLFRPLSLPVRFALPLLSVAALWPAAEVSLAACGIGIAGLLLAAVTRERHEREPAPEPGDGPAGSSRS